MLHPTRTSFTQQELHHSASLTAAVSSCEHGQERNHQYQYQCKECDGGEVFGGGVLVCLCCLGCVIQLIHLIGPSTLLQLTYPLR